MANTRPSGWGPNATYIPPGLALGVTQILAFALGVMRILVFTLGVTQILASPTQNCGVWGLSQSEWFCVAVEYRLYNTAEIPQKWL